MIDNLPGVATASMPPPSTAPATNPTNPLNEQDFMQLMTQELQDQDPTNPTDPTQFIGQLAQFSQVDATETMQQSVSQLAASLATSQAMNAANLIGKQVLAPSQTLTLGSGGATGAVAVPATASDVKVTISDVAGNPVQVLDLGPQAAGNATFTWNGTNAAGAQVPPGTYVIAASNGAQALATYAGGAVTSVAASSSGASVNVAGVGNVALNQISQIF